MSAIAEEIAKLSAEAAKKQAESDLLAKMAAAYPDLRKQIGRWNKVVFCSKSVNTKATRFDMRHNCGCCADSPLEIWPYIETEFGKVYSDPPEFRVGEQDPFTYRDRPYPGWDDKMRAAGIPDDLIAAVGFHFGDEEDAPQDPELPDYSVP